MQARLIAYPPDSAATVRLIGADEVLRIGRASDSADPGQLVLNHASVSRVHAELRGEDGIWRLVDCGSKNGSYVEGSPVSDARLGQPCWLRFGDIYCEFTPLSQAEAETSARRQLDRRTLATAHTRRIERLTELGDLLDASLRAVLELTQCERGFVLIDEGQGLVVRASLSLDPVTLASREFSGSMGAVKRALQQRQTVVANELRSDAWLASRESVLSAGLSSLVCLPLLDGPQMLGAIYVDRVSRGPAIDTLDLELLGAFAENAAVWISARRATDIIDDRPSETTAWRHIVAAHTEDME